LASSPGGRLWSPTVVTPTDDYLQAGRERGDVRSSPQSSVGRMQGPHSLLGGAEERATLL